MLRLAAESGRPCAPVRHLVGSQDIDAAYAVQRFNNQERIQKGQRPVGSKIGLTSAAVQRQLGVNQPDFGQLFADMALCDGEEIAAGRLIQPKIETEIALVLEQDLPHEKNTLADLIRATAYLLPALEVVDSRIAGWDISLADTIADNASCGLFVLGNRPVQLKDVNLLGCGMVLERAGEPVSVGAGAACLGNPLFAALWLADTLAQRGNALRAGDIILTGALGPMVAACAGDVFSARIEGLGQVSTRFASATGGDQ
ncbi:2-keto-4-pentenoate hydratase [Serratia liquefaciens]|uniref:2-keto-4-pentenoate hydratase n=1 Tax=Serratia liquefaciens TaxID=614 RepID=UPI0021CAA75B|nr:fumarylacetoacetate hydrolase family protein [Serratia liquefaciens]